jgi:hypothetical protein
MNRELAAILLITWNTSPVLAQSRSPYDPAIVRQQQLQDQLQYQADMQKVAAIDQAIKERGNKIADAIEAAKLDIDSAKCSDAEHRVNDAILGLDEIRQQQVSLMLKDSANPVQHQWAQIARINIPIIDNAIAQALVLVAEMALKGSCLDVADDYYRAVIAKGGLSSNLIHQAQIGVDDVRARRATAK